MDDLIGLLGGLPLPIRLAIFVGLAIVTHLLVVLVRGLASYFLTHQRASRFQKLRSIGTLATSVVVFSLYFFAVGLILREFGVSLTAYLASASVVGLAIGFGSQGIVQDVVTGLTFIFSDLLNVGELVEVSAATGVVRAITMRFVELEGPTGASIFVPNRTITNLTNYPLGYLRCTVDISLRGEEPARQAAERAALRLMESLREQFPGIFIGEPSSEGRLRFKTGKEILRLSFPIWPGRGQPIESAYLQELAAELKQADPEYQSWMIAVSYGAEAKQGESAKSWPWRVRSHKATVDSNAGPRDQIE